MKNRLREWREKRGYTQEAFADLAGKKRLNIIRIEKGETGFTDKNKIAFAKLLDCKPEDFLYLDNVEPTGHNIAQIRGYVQAGQWGEADEFHLGDLDVLHTSPDYPTAYGLIVKGDSMNKKYKDGARLVCVPVDDFNGEIKPGYSVIVEAICHADEIETTVKEYYRDDEGNEWLIPKSTNPTYQNYPVPNGMGLDIVLNNRRVKDIQIKAVVTEVYQSEIF